MDDDKLEVDEYLTVFDKKPNKSVMRIFAKNPFVEKLVNNFLVLFCVRYVGAVYVFGLMFLLLYFNGYTSCPAYYGSLAACQYPIMFAYFAMIQVCVNFALFHWNSKRNRVHSLVPADLLSKCSQDYRMANGFTGLTDTWNSVTDRNGSNSSDRSPWKYCHTCQLVIPQRCHHCPLCEYCVLKKDHHCFMTGGCVGGGNQRYFVVFLFWAMLGAGYSMLYMIRFLTQTYSNFWSIYFLDYVLPVTFVKLLFTDQCSWTQFGHVMLFNVGLMAFFGAVGFFFFQCYLIVRNRTMYEHFKRQSYETSLTPMQRIRIVFGPMFLLNFIIPLPSKNKLDLSLVHFINECTLKEEI